MIIDEIDELTREELVEKYLTVKLAGLVNHIGVGWFRMPTDVSQDPAYWRNIDGDLHTMHKEIARRYHIDWYDCLWLENMVDNDTLYIYKRQFNAIVRDSIKLLEEAEEKKMRKATTP